jgi:serine/threonine protein phosphatase PrpC
MRDLPELKCDKEMVHGGSTCCSIWLYNHKIFSANIGDCRFVLSRKGKAEQKTTDHKPKCPSEMARIKKAGGFVSSDNRVNGKLAVSRAFGDYVHKQRTDLRPDEQMVIVVPDVCVIDVDDSIDFLVRRKSRNFNFASFRSSTYLCRQSPPTDSGTG